MRLDRRSFLALLPLSVLALPAVLSKGPQPAHKGVCYFSNETPKRAAGGDTWIEPCGGMYYGRFFDGSKWVNIDFGGTA